MLPEEMDTTRTTGYMRRPLDTVNEHSIESEHRSTGSTLGQSQGYQRFLTKWRKQMNGLWYISKCRTPMCGTGSPGHLCWVCNVGYRDTYVGHLCRTLGYHVVVGCSDQYEYVGRQFHGIQVFELHGIRVLDIRQKWLQIHQIMRFELFLKLFLSFFNKEKCIRNMTMEIMSESSRHSISNNFSHVI